METIKREKSFGVTFWQLTRRHLLVFFRNKIRVFFTLMVPFIIFLIYIFFLRDLELATATSILSDIDKDLLDDKELNRHIGGVIDSWMLSGILAISTITVSLHTNCMIVSDKETGVNRDFASSPLSRNFLIGSYFFFNIIVTVMICFIFLLVCLVYLACMGEFLITFVDFLTIVATLLFSSVSSVLLTVFICSFVSRDSTMASINTVFSTAVGFIIGAYMPLATMPGWVQNICAFFSGTYSCSLLRYSFLSTPIKELTSYVQTNLGHIAEIGTLTEQLTQSFGFNIKFFGITVGPDMQSVAQFVFIVLLVVANVLVGKNLVSIFGGKKNKKKK